MQMALMSAKYMELCQYHLMGTGRQSARERIAFLLLELYHRALGQQEQANSGHIHFPVCQEEIADAVGLTTVHVNRTLKELKADGMDPKPEIMVPVTCSVNELTETKVIFDKVKVSKANVLGAVD